MPGPQSGPPAREIQPVAQLTGLNVRVGKGPDGLKVLQLEIGLVLELPFAKEAARQLGQQLMDVGSIEIATSMPPAMPPRPGG